VKFAICDPPYIGCAHLYPEKEEVDHAALIARLIADYPDGWVLCCHPPSIRVLLPLCPDDVRIGAWVKPWAVWKNRTGPVYAWESVLWRGGRKYTRQQQQPRDWVTANALMGQRATGGVPGAKPEAVCFWYFQLLNAAAGDTLDDLYLGSGNVTRAWTKWQHRLPFEIGQAALDGPDATPALTGRE